MVIANTATVSTLTRSVRGRRNEHRRPYQVPRLHRRREYARPRISHQRRRLLVSYLPRIRRRPAPDDFILLGGACVIYFFCGRRSCYKKTREGFKASPKECGGCSNLCTYEPRFKPYLAINPATCPYWPNPDNCPDRRDESRGGCMTCIHAVWIDTPEKERVHIAMCDDLNGGE